MKMNVKASKPMQAKAGYSRENFKICLLFVLGR